MSEASPAPGSTLVVIVPTYNERQTIRQIVSEVLAQEERLPGFAVKVLVADSMSDDGTIDVVSDMLHDDARIHLLLVAEPGYGVAVLKAHRHAIDVLKANIVASIDADLSHEPRQLPDLVIPLTDGYEMSIGSRYVEGGGTAGWPIGRQIMSLAANQIIRAVTGCWEIREFTSGYRAFTTGLYERMDIRSIAYNDYTLLPALVYEAVRAGARVKEIPIMFENRRWGKSKLPLVEYTMNLLRHFLLARFRRRAAT